MYIISTYVIRINVKKENLNLKDVTVIYPVTGWFEIKKHTNKEDISITNWVESMWVSRYPRPMDIIYDQGS